MAFLSGSLRSSLLLAAAICLMADGPPPRARTWLLEQPIAAGQTLELNLVRASVRVVRQAGPASVTIVPRGDASLSGIEFRVAKTARGIAITDVYPRAAPGSARECEPPSDQRGAYWRSETVFDVSIVLPPGVLTKFTLLEEVAPRAH